MGSQWGRHIRLSVFGESHGPGVGMVLDGFPAGMPVDFDALCRLLSRRAPSDADGSTARQESDEPEFLSGLKEGVTTGAPISAMIRNQDARSEDYESIKDIPRPGHADFTARLRYKGHADTRGGGHLSGRLTAPMVLAGALCMQWVARSGVTIGAHLSRVGELEDEQLHPVDIQAQQLERLVEMPFPVLCEKTGAIMQYAIREAAMGGDSLGGVVECAAVGIPAGIGGPIMDGMEAVLSGILFSIPACKAVEFGDGFALAAMRGSQANDAFSLDGGRVVTGTNRCGGLLGGITTGMPLVFRAAFKPTPSISLPQQTINLVTGLEETLRMHGRHDACIAVRALPAVEAACALAVMDVMLETMRVS